MANLRIFISSTAFDLSILRSSLKAFVAGLGYDPVLSEYSDVLFDFREHTHKSCLAEIKSCDMVVLIIGARFGSTFNSSVLSSELHEFDPDDLQDGESSISLSVTQAEALTAAKAGIPVFSFVQGAVYHDYTVYQKNRDQSFANKIAYPSIAQPETAEYIFNFIDYLESRSYNNAIATFERLEEVIEYLQKQWAALFQRLLTEARSSREDALRIDRLADQFDDLKAVLLASIGDSLGRNAARDVIRYRHLISFLGQAPNPGLPMRELVVAADRDFRELLRDASHFVEIVEPEPSETRMPGRVMFISIDGALYHGRLSMAAVMRMEREWQGFRALSPTDRGVIYDAVIDSAEMSGPGILGRVRRMPESTLAGEGTLSATTHVSPASGHLASDEQGAAISSDSGMSTTD